MFVAMFGAALAVDALFSALGLLPGGPRPSRTDIFQMVAVNYKLVLNVLGVFVFSSLFALTVRRRATEPLRSGA